MATFDFSGKLLTGEIRSVRARRLVREWSRLHGHELRSNWRRLKALQPPRQIAPLGVGAMALLPRVIEARYVSGYKIDLLFNTGLRKTVDFTRWLRGPVFEPLRNRTEFRKFFIAGGTVCWPNGADIAPETLFSIRGASEHAA